MRKFFPKIQEGVTLLEILLVLSIAGLLLVMGVKGYQFFENLFQVQNLKYNVDALFEAAGNYYKANCAAGDFSPKPPVFLSPYPVNAGTLVYPPATTAYYPLSISSTLLAQGYLENWYPANPLVDPADGESGYIVQLNPIVSTDPLPVNACVVTTPGTPCLPITSTNITSPNQAYSGAPTSTISSTQAQIVTWVLQVAVKIQPQSEIGAYAALLGADCLSDSSSAGTVDPCAVGNTRHRYLVWSRIPTLGALKRNAIFSTSMQSLKQYNRMYTHDQDNEFNGGYSLTTNPVQAPVYYLCGG